MYYVPICKIDLPNLRSVTCIIPGKPVPLLRPRFSGRRIFDTQKKIKIDWGIILTEQLGDMPFFVGPLHLQVTFYFPIPQSSQKRQDSIKDTLFFYKPDVDNLVKFIADCANGILYKDDANIASLFAQKLYSDQPRTELTLVELSPYKEYMHEEKNKKQYKK